MAAVIFGKQEGRIMLRDTRPSIKEHIREDTPDEEILQYVEICIGNWEMK